MPLFLDGILIGLGATALMDVWTQGLGRLPGQSPPNWTLVGRWFRHLPQGRVFHPDITAADPSERDRATGWAAHYAVGIVYGIAFALLMGPGWFAAPTLLPAWIFGIVTIGFGWFLLQPGMGLGWAASRTPNPTRGRLLGLAAHSVFGLGLWLTALVIR